MNSREQRIVSRVSVIGAGTMGHGIAEVVALRGFSVRLEDSFPKALDNARESIKESLSRLVNSSKISEAEAASAMQRIVFNDTIVDAVSDADLVIEAVPEDLALKQRVLSEVVSAAPPSAILATNTSNIRVSSIADVLKDEDKGRVVGLHFFNPPVINRLVEVVRTRYTREEVYNLALEFTRKLGKTPVGVQVDSPGFIVNRITAPETLVFSIVLDRGAASPESVDNYFRGQGLPMGPYELMDYVGLDVVLHSLRYYASEISPEYGAYKTIQAKVESGQLGRKTGKGFYDWSSGKPAVPRATPSEAVSLSEVIALEVNEAAKLAASGVSSPEDIETAVKLGLNRPFGPLTAAKALKVEEIVETLNRVSQKFGLKVSEPSPSLVELIQGKTGERSPLRGGTADSGSDAGEAPMVGVSWAADHVAVITLSNARHNFINREMLLQLESVVTRLRSDERTRCLVIRGSGRCFSAGAQLTQFFDSSISFMEASRLGQKVFDEISRLPFVTIAQISEHALGGGLELALNCDIRVATPDAELGFPEARLGLVPSWSGTQRLTRIAGLSNAAYMVLTGKSLKGEEAMRRGLVSLVVDTERIEAETISVASNVASLVSPLSVKLAKPLLYKFGYTDAQTGLAAEAASAGILFASEDLREGVSSFLSKRQPHFKGR